MSEPMCFKIPTEVRPTTCVEEDRATFLTSNTNFHQFFGYSSIRIAWASLFGVNTTQNGHYDNKTLSIMNEKHNIHY